jgi:3-hydroxybutyryl-CoA dehydratase
VSRRPGERGAAVKHFEDFQVGDVYRSSRGRTITEADIVNFCMFSGDWYPLHSDVEYAQKSPFGERIAHGLLVLSVASGLMPLYDMAIVAFYGMDKVRFVGPTRIGDTLHLVSEVLEKQDKGDLGGVVTLIQRIRNQRDEDAVVSTWKVLIAKRDFTAKRDS